MSLSNSTTPEIVNKIFILLVVLALITALDALIPSPSDCSWDFRISLWGPSNRLVRGQTPYTQDTSYGPYSGIWMPQIIGAFLFLGLLPCPVAAKIWFISEIAGLFLMIWLVAGRKLPSPTLFGFCLLLVLLFPPMYIHFAMGQISILITVLVMLVVFLPKEDHSPLTLRWWIPLFLALGLAKHLLGVLVYPGLLVGVYRHQGMGAAIKLITLTAGWVALLILPVSLIDPGWLQGFLDVTLGNINIPWDLPVPLVQLRMNLGSTGIVLWALIFLAILSFVFWLWLNYDAKLAVLWSLALTPIATPYCSSWDFVLIVPLMLWLLIQLQSKLARIGLILGALLIDLLQVTTRWHTRIPDGRYWWVPIAFLVVFILSIGVEQMLMMIKTSTLIMGKPD